MVEGDGLENRYILMGIEGSNPSLSAIFLGKKNGGTKTQVFSSLRKAQLHLKGAAFSSHLHKKREALLVKTFALLTCEVAHFIRL